MKFLKNKLSLLYFILLLLSPAIALAKDYAWEDLLKMSPEELANLDEDVIANSLYNEIAPGLPTFKNIVIDNAEKPFPFWKRTMGARTRDPLFLLPRRRFIFDKSGVDFQVFFNRTSHLSVMPSTMLDMDSVNFLKNDILGNYVKLIDDPGKLGTILEALPFLEKITVQEHRIGGMINVGLRRGRWGVQLDTVLQLAERNYWMSKKNRNTLSAILGIEEDTRLNDVMKMRFGLSDTRLKLGYTVIDKKKSKMAVGVSVIVPTSRIFDKKPKPVCDLTNTSSLTRKQLVKDLLAVTRAILIKPRLGTGHWGVGLFAEGKWAVIPHTLDVWGRLSFDYLFGGHEYRFMPPKTGITLTHLEMFQEESEFVPEGFPTELLFPCLARVHVKPGHIFNATVGLDWHMTKHWLLYGGYDYYHQQQERVSAGQCLAAPALINHKLFLGLDYTHKGKKRDWVFGVGGDVSLASGKYRPVDWTISGKIGITF